MDPFLKSLRLYYTHFALTSEPLTKQMQKVLNAFNCPNKGRSKTNKVDEGIMQKRTTFDEERYEAGLLLKNKKLRPSINFVSAESQLKYLERKRRKDTALKTRLRIQ